MASTPLTKDRTYPSPPKLDISSYSDLSVTRKELVMQEVFSKTILATSLLPLNFTLFVLGERNQRKPGHPEGSHAHTYKLSIFASCYSVSNCLMMALTSRETTPLLCDNLVEKKTAHHSQATVE